MPMLTLLNQREAARSLSAHPRTLSVHRLRPSVRQGRSSGPLPFLRSGCLDQLPHSHFDQRRRSLTMKRSRIVKRSERTRAISRLLAAIRRCDRLTRSLSVQRDLGK